MVEEQACWRVAKIKSHLIGQALYSSIVSSLALFSILSILQSVHSLLARFSVRNIPKFEDRRSKLPSKSDVARYIYIGAKQLRVSNTARGGSVGLGPIRLSSGQRCLLLETIITTWQTQIV